MVLDAESLSVVKRVVGAHMTFATSVAFSPDEQFIISGAGAWGWQAGGPQEGWPGARWQRAVRHSACLPAVSPSGACCVWERAC